MSNISKNIALKALVFGLFAVAFLWRCANIYAPQGGPRDTLAPKVVLMKPDFAAKNFKDKRIYIEFDEYVQLKDQQKEFYTSPIMAVKPMMTLRGRGIVIDIKDDSLKPNTTYSLNFGNAVADNNESNVLSGLRYVFSTGNEIDSLVMSGYTADAKTKDSVAKAFLFFYDVAKDSLKNLPYDSTLFKRKPDAVGRAENNGIFLTQNLKPIDYRVYAIKDENSNQQYDAGVDMVAFVDSTFNPLSMPDFAVWYDTTRKYLVAEPQTYFKLFMDKTFNRQNLAKSARPLQHKVELLFNAAHPIIEGLTIEGVDSSKIIFERPTIGKDTIFCWLDVPSETLPDTLKVTLNYFKHDSIRNLTPAKEELKLFWKAFEKKKSKKEEKEEKEAPPVNPFKFTVTASNTINPLRPIPFSFDYPLRSIDSTAISLIRTDEQKRKFKVKNSFVRDTANLRQWNLHATWQPGQEYQLLIPDSVITNILGEQNDTIKVDFKTMAPDQYASFKLKVKGKTPQSKYIVEILNGGRVAERRTDITTGEHIFNYIEPGTATIRVTEDVNGNGMWDTGDLVERRQPERVEIFITPEGETEIVTKVNWELTFELDMDKVFAPETMQSTIDMLQKRELERIKKAAREREQSARQSKTNIQKREPDSNDNNGSSGELGNPLGRSNTRNF